MRDEEVRLPWWIGPAVVAITLPRSVLSDHGVVESRSGPYFVIALVPFAVWLAAAIVRPTADPIRVQLRIGVLYGLSLIAVHELFWRVPASIGQHPPQFARELAGRVAAPLDQVVLHAATWLVALAIGLGVGLITGLAGTVSRLVRSRTGAGRRRQAPSTPS